LDYVGQSELRKLRGVGVWVGGTIVFTYHRPKDALLNFTLAVVLQEWDACGQHTLVENNN
jgi:hypothetical protein